MTSPIAIVQARMGSTRLPGKSLRFLAGRPVLQHVVERAQRAGTVKAVVVATTTDAADDAIVALCARMGVRCFRGAARDVLDRYARAAEEFGGNPVVRLTGDDPLKDPAVIDRIVTAFLTASPRYDYVSNTIRPTYPEGQDVEVFSRVALADAAREATDPYEREHVTPFLYNRPDRYRCLNVEAASDLSRHRWTLDTEEDLAFFSAVFSALGATAGDPSMDEVLSLLERRPDIATINSDVKRSARYA